MNPAHATTKPRPLTAPRLVWLDALRGLAVVAMIGYHFSFDLSYLGWLQQNPYLDPHWQLARTLILGSFLLTVGMSHALSEAQKLRRQRRWQRLVRIGLAAALVTVASSLLFPSSIIWFGTLHAIAIMGLLMELLPWRRWPTAFILLLAGLMLVAGSQFQHPLFDQPWLAWLGLMTHLPRTEDYVPLLPWFALVLLGYAGMRWLLRHDMANPPPGMHAPCWLQYCGRHSLAIYLVHQPILLGLLIPLNRYLRTS